MLDIVPMAMCKSNDFWEAKVTSKKSGEVYTVTFDRHSHSNHQVQCDYSCTCPSYKFGKGKYCKHILEVKDKHCGWHQQTDGGEAKNGKCPQCGGDIVGIMVGV